MGFNLAFKGLNKQTLHLLEMIMKQYYFHYNEWFLQPDKAISVGSDISSTMAEVNVQYIEETYVKQWLESKEILYYKRYDVDIFIIHDHCTEIQQLYWHKYLKKTYSYWYHYSIFLEPPIRT